MTMENPEVPIDVTPTEEVEQQKKIKTIAQVIEDIESGNWKNMSGEYLQSGELPHVYQMDPELAVIRRSILLKSDEQTGAVLDKVNSIEEWLKYEFYPSGELKEIHSVTFDGTGRQVLEKHKKYDEKGRLS